MISVPQTLKTWKIVSHVRLFFELFGRQGSRPGNPFQTFFGWSWDKPRFFSIFYTVEARLVPATNPDCPWDKPPRGRKRDKLKGTNRAKLAFFCKFLLIFAQSFADFSCFSLFLGIVAFRRRRFSQKTAGNRRKPQIFAENHRKAQIFAEIGLSHFVRSFYFRPNPVCPWDKPGVEGRDKKFTC